MKEFYKLLGVGVGYKCDFLLKPTVIGLDVDIKMVGVINNVFAG